MTQIPREFPRKAASEGTEADRIATVPLTDVNLLHKCDSDGDAQPADRPQAAGVADVPLLLVAVAGSVASQAA
jgi:hypothetical protein